MINTWKLVCEKNLLSAPLSAPTNRSIRHLYSASLAELFRYTIVTQVNRKSYGGWILTEEEFQETKFVKILLLTC